MKKNNDTPRELLTPEQELLVAEKLHNEILHLQMKYPSIGSNFAIRTMMAGLKAAIDKQDFSDNLLIHFHEGFLQALTIEEQNQNREGVGRNKKWEYFQVPEHLRDFNTYIQTVLNKEREEEVLNAEQSASDSLIMGEILSDQLFISYRRKVQERALEQVAEAEVGKDEFTSAPERETDLQWESFESDKGEMVEFISGDSLISQIGEKKVFEMLAGRDESLLIQSSQAAQVIGLIILRLRNNIRSGNGEGAVKKKDRIREAGKIANI